MSIEIQTSIPPIPPMSRFHVSPRYQESYFTTILTWCHPGGWSGGKGGGRIQALPREEDFARYKTGPLLFLVC